MEYRRVGTSGLRVSAISIGGWLTFGASLDKNTTGAVLRAALDGGVNLVDLADVYARGEAERVVGAILSDFRRSDLVLSSKLFWPMSDDANDRGLSRKHIMESVQRTLRNLGVDYLDIYFCHREDPGTPLDETIAAMDDLIHQGKILYWGTSLFRPRTLRRVHGLARHWGRFAPIVEQPPYNLLERWIERKVMPTAKRLGMGLVVWSPLAGGVLTGKYSRGISKGSRGAATRELEKYLNQPTLDRVRRFCAIAKKQDLEPGQLALAWLLQRSEISSLITGATSPEQVRSNLGALEVRIPDAVNGEIQRLFPVPGRLARLRRIVQPRH